MENINIAEILKDCPKGMELYSTIYGTVYFEGVRDTGNAVLIDVKTSCNTEAQFYPDGKFNTYYSDSEMTLFPSKDVRTWEGFVPPCKFKDGDIVVTLCNSGNTWISIFKKRGAFGLVETYADVAEDGSDFYLYGVALCDEEDIDIQRLATEEEKAKLFNTIKANGYEWNEGTKTLEKLIEPKPKFKVGDRIKHKNNHNVCFTITNIEEDSYFCGANLIFGFDDQNNYELVIDKFDISTLVPFESKVLVRDDDYDEWRSAFWGHLRQKADMKYDTLRGVYRQCIPYEGNEHLLGKTNDCDNFYKTWE